MLTGNSTPEVLTQKFLKISTSTTSQHPKDHNKSFSKHLAKRDQLSDMVNDKNLSSLEDYYYNGSGSSVSVPFMWESQPGTPKVKFRENPNLPPLTPPPSYCYRPAAVTKTSSSPLPNNSRKTNLLQTIFPKHYAARRRRSPTSPSLSLSSSSSLSSNSPRSTLYSSSVPSSPVVSKTPSLKSGGWRRNIISSPRFSLDSRVDDDHDHEHEDEYSSPVSTLCFGRAGVNPRSRSRCYSSLIKVLHS